MTLRTTVNKKLASSVAVEKAELCLLTSKAFITKVILSIVIVPRTTSERILIRVHIKCNNQLMI
jgi:hypothetical protein